MIPFKRLALLGMALALNGCSVLESDKVDYKSTAKAPSLLVPPDLTQLSRDNRYAIAGGAVTASSYQSGLATAAAPVAAAAISDIRVERLGNQRWLVVKRPAQQLWDPIKDFWQESGFVLTLDQSNLGIMETDWAENRAKIPMDYIRSALGKLLDSLYATAERDRFRTRLERTPSGDTEIYISHRGMVEVFTAVGAKDSGSTVWQPRPADAELEAEFLRRLMLRLGAASEQVKAVAAANTAKPVSRESSINGKPVVLIDEDFDRAWRRVGLSLDRTGFTVEDRDRSQGTYFVRYVEPSRTRADVGLFTKIFGDSSKGPEPLKYRIVLRSDKDTTVVSVLDASGAPDNSANAQRIVSVIVNDLK